MPNHPEYPNIPLKEMLCLYDLDQTYDLVLPEKIGWWADYWTDAHWFFTPYVGSNVYGGILIDYFTPDMSPFADQLSNILYDWYAPLTGTDNWNQARNLIEHPYVTADDAIDFKWLEDIINPTIDWDNGIALTIALPAGEGTGTISYYIDESVSHWWLDRIKYASVCLNKRVIHYKLTSEPQTITIPIRTEGTFYAGYGSPIIGTFVVSGAEAEAIKGGSIPSFWLYENLPSLLDTISGVITSTNPYFSQWFSGYRVKSEIGAVFETLPSTDGFTPFEPELGGNWSATVGTGEYSVNSWTVAIGIKYPIAYESYTTERPAWYRFCWLRTANNQRGQLVEREDRQTGNYCYYFRYGYPDARSEYRYKQSYLAFTDPIEFFSAERDYVFVDNYLDGDYTSPKWVIGFNVHRVKAEDTVYGLNVYQVASGLGYQGGLYTVRSSSATSMGNDPGAGVAMTNLIIGEGDRSPSFTGGKKRFAFLSLTQVTRLDWGVYSHEWTFTLCEGDISDTTSPISIVAQQSYTLPPQPRSYQKEIPFHYVYDDVITWELPESIFSDISDTVTPISWETYLATQDLTIMVDSQRIKEIHAALQADKYAWLDSSTETLRTANLGYLIERLARIMGISVNPDGTIRSIRQKKVLMPDESGKLTIPPGWYMGQFGLNYGGTTVGQEGGNAGEERDGIVYENRSNSFVGDIEGDCNNELQPSEGVTLKLRNGGYVLCENIPQLLDAMLDDLDKGLNWQEMGAGALPNASGDGKMCTYEGMGTLLAEAVWMLSHLSGNIQRTEILAKQTAGMTQELISALGLPVEVKQIPVQTDKGKTQNIPYIGLAPHAPSLTEQLGWVLQNLAPLVGKSLRPGKDVQKQIEADLQAEIQKYIEEQGLNNTTEV